MAGGLAALAYALHSDLQLVLNQVERFFALITDKATRRGSFTSAKQLVQRIDHFATSYNSNCKPFRWTATAGGILAKLH